MIWLVRSRRLAVVAVLLVAAVALVVVAASAAVPFPELAVHTGLAVPAVYASPVVAACLVLSATISALPTLEATAGRALVAVDAAVTTSLVTGVALVLLAMSRFADQPALQASARNLIGLVGIGLVVRLVANQAASVAAPVLYLVIVFSFGHRSGGHTWDWPLASRSDPLSWGIAVALLAVGLWAASSQQSRRVTLRHDGDDS